MKRKSYELVAWTDNDGVRMIPSLANGAADSYLKKIRELEAMDEWVPAENEIRWLLEISAEYEKLSDFYLRLGRRSDAYHALEKAALACANGSDILWIDADYGFFPVLPLFRRFLAMHGRAKKLAKESPMLKAIYEGSALKKDFLLYTADGRHFERELKEALLENKAWNRRPDM